MSGRYSKKFIIGALLIAFFLSFFPVVLDYLYDKNLAATISRQEEDYQYQCAAVEEGCNLLGHAQTLAETNHKSSTHYRASRVHQAANVSIDEYSKRIHHGIGSWGHIMPVVSLEATNKPGKKASYAEAQDPIPPYVYAQVLSQWIVLAHSMEGQTYSRPLHPIHNQY